MLQNEQKRFAAITAAARKGNLSRKEINSLVEFAKTLQSPHEKASVLRFALRVARLSETQSQQIVGELGALYEIAAHAAQEASESRRVLAWARRYGRVVDLDTIERRVFDEIRQLSSYFERQTKVLIRPV